LNNLKDDKVELLKRIKDEISDAPY
jgi:hypothetical protein